MQPAKSFRTAGAMMAGGKTPRGKTDGAGGRKDLRVPFLPGYHPDMQGGLGHVETFHAGGGKITSDLTDHPIHGHVPGQVPKIDLSVLKTLKDPMHRYNQTARSLTHDERYAMKESARNTYRPRIAPAWLKHDGQVLHFLAYFQEPVHESPKENFHVRECVIYYYLEDGTMMVSEPKVENSGIPQGTFVKRHKIPKPGGGYYSYPDLDCGITVSIYSRAFRIVDCDNFTRNFFENVAKQPLRPSEKVPVDYFRASIEEGVEFPGPRSPKSASRNREIHDSKEYTELSLGGNRKNIRLQQYLENDRKVLCFKCYWDDATRYGARMYYQMHYYLADDSVEFLESLSRNSGRDPYPVFWKRNMLRKNPHVNAAPGMSEPEPIIYKPEDFIVGTTVNLYGRDIFLYDCDEFTREFFRQYMGIEQECINIPDPGVVHVKLSPPPHNGFGTEEDSLASCFTLTPRVPRRDVNKLMAMSDKAMRFEAQMVLASPEDRSRRFVVAIHLADDGVSVWEVHQRNNGYAGGKFASKARQRNPETGAWLCPKDFSTGTTVTINAVSFLLGQADEATLQYMEANSAEFPSSNPRLVASKLVGLKDALKQGPDPLPVAALAELAATKLELQFTEPELTTLRRAFGQLDAPELILTGKLLERLG
jgi:hypothetical protein